MFSSVFMDFGAVFKFKGRGFIIPQLRGERRYWTSREGGGAKIWDISYVAIGPRVNGWRCKEKKTAPQLMMPAIMA